jgi:hypothetical protein
VRCAQGGLRDGRALTGVVKSRGCRWANMRRRSKNGGGPKPSLGLPALLSTSRQGAASPRSHQRASASTRSCAIVVAIVASSLRRPADPVPDAGRPLATARSSRICRIPGRRREHRGVLAGCRVRCRPGCGTLHT